MPSAEGPVESSITRLGELLDLVFPEETAFLPITGRGRFPDFDLHGFVEDQRTAYAVRIHDAFARGGELEVHRALEVEANDLLKVLCRIFRDTGLDVAMNERDAISATMEVAWLRSRIAAKASACRSLGGSAPDLIRTMAPVHPERLGVQLEDLHKVFETLDKYVLHLSRTRST